MTADVSIFAALFAGVISFLSPCVLPLVPPYLVYLAGTSLERLAGRRAGRRACGARPSWPRCCSWRVSRPCSWRSAPAPARSGSVLRFYSNELAMVAGVFIIIMGLHFLGITPIGLLNRQARLDVQKPVGLWGAYVMGLAFAFGWTPCIGPILAAILAVAGSQATVMKGAGLLAVYSLGLGMPFLIAALAVEPFAAFLVRFRAPSRAYGKGHGRAAGADRRGIPRWLLHAVQ